MTTTCSLGTVGLTEEAAIATYGEDAIDSYISSFSPLEWSLIEKAEDVSCYAKVS
jgi:hypothetical protein